MLLPFKHRNEAHNGKTQIQEAEGDLSASHEIEAWQDELSCRLSATNFKASLGNSSRVRVHIGKDHENEGYCENNKGHLPTKHEAGWGDEEADCRKTARTFYAAGRTSSSICNPAI